MRYDLISILKVKQSGNRKEFLFNRDESITLRFHMESLKWFRH